MSYIWAVSFPEFIAVGVPLRVACVPTIRRTVPLVHILCVGCVRFWPQSTVLHLAVTPLPRPPPPPDPPPSTFRLKEASAGRGSRDLRPQTHAYELRDETLGLGLGVLRTHRSTIVSPRGVWLAYDRLSAARRLSAGPSHVPVHTHTASHHAHHMTQHIVESPGQPVIHRPRLATSFSGRSRSVHIWYGQQ